MRHFRAIAQDLAALNTTTLLHNVFPSFPAQEEPNLTNNTILSEYDKVGPGLSFRGR